MLADGTDISAMERAMSEALARGLRAAMSSPRNGGMELVEVESGGFPTVPLRMSRGYTPMVPVVALRGEASVDMAWLRRQSREWASKELARAVSVVADRMASAARLDGARTPVGLDRSSLRAMFEPSDDGFVIRFFVGLAYDGGIEEEGGVIRTDQPAMDVGVLDLGHLPDEVTSIVAGIMDAVDRGVGADSDFDAMIEAMSEDEMTFD